MMKYVMNHPKEFESPKIAFSVGLNKFMIGTVSEVIAVMIISTANDTITVILQQVGLGVLIRIGQFVAMLTTSNLELKKANVEFKIKFYREINHEVEHEENRGAHCSMTLLKIMRCIYQFCRMIFVYVQFYIIPFFVIILPFYSFDTLIC